jgi:hypothetical protein
MDFSGRIKGKHFRVVRCSSLRQGFVNLEFVFNSELRKLEK